MKKKIEMNTKEKDVRRRRNFLNYSIVIIVGYAITQIGSLVAKKLGLSSITYEEIFFILSTTIGFTLIVTVLVLFKKSITDLFLQNVIRLQFGFWLLLYALWVYFLHEARILGLFFAFMPLIFLATNSSLIQSMIISVAVTVLQLCASYYGIYFANQNGSFVEVIFYTSWFFPSSVYIAYVAGLFHRKRRELRSAKRDAEKARDALWGEMEIAKKIQTILLPKKPNMSGYEIASYMSPADEIGGDYYDVISIDGNNWIVIGDVSGHGVPAGLIMMMVQTAIHNSLEDNPKLSPSELLSKINRTIANNIKMMGEDKYMTITVFAELEDNFLLYSGLHQDILIYRDATDSVEIIQTEGIWIGLMDNIESMNVDKKFHLDAGDCLLLYTDGITESWESNPNDSTKDRSDNLFGGEKLEELLKTNGKQSPEMLKQLLLNELKNYNSDDDITFLILKRVA